MAPPWNLRQGTIMDLEGAGNSLVNIILGALILWVGQTTFTHNGELAGIDHKFEAVAAQHEHLQARLEGLLSALEQRTQQRFTSKDGDVLRDAIKETAAQVDALRMQVFAIKSQQVDRWEIARLKNDLRQDRRPGGLDSGPSIAARTSPAYLPTPVARR